MRVRLTYPSTEFVLRQTPRESGTWADAQFETVGSGPYDAWVVYEHLPFPQYLLVDAARTIFVAGEPHSIRSYDPRFLAQFAAVIAPQREIEHPNLIVRQPAIPWWVGVTVTSQPGKTAAGYTLNYDQLKAIRSFDKPKLASVICSDKAVTEGHRLRLRLLQSLRARFDGVIDFFGHGFTPVTDKWEAIAPYRYHVVLENTRAEHYWTEKLADTFLAGAFPIYCGCPNLGDYFPADAFHPIDRNDPDTAVATIEQVLRDDRYAGHWPAVDEARRRVLDRYNLFPMLAEVIRQLPRGVPKKIRFKPEQDFTDPPARRYKRAVKRLIFGNRLS